MSASDSAAHGLAVVNHIDGKHIASLHMLTDLTHNHLCLCVTHYILVILSECCVQATYTQSIV